MSNERRLRLLVTLVGIAGLAAASSAIPRLLEGGVTPEWWKLALAGAAFVAGDLVLLHLRFGKDNYSFTWSEAAVVVGLAIVPAPFLRLVAPAGVALAHSWRSPAKMIFNAGASACAIFLSRYAYEGVAGGSTELNAPRTWVGLAAGSFVFWMVNGALVSAVVAASQRLSFWKVHSEGFILSLMVWAGNTAVGILFVVIAGTAPAMLAVLPVPFGMLLLLYRSYHRAMRERDTWEVLQQASRELLLVDEDELARVVLTRTAALFKAEFAELVLAEDEGCTRVTVFRQTADGFQVHSGAPFETAGTFWGRVLSDREEFELKVATAPSTQRHELVELGLASCLVAPLISQDRCIGAVRIGFGQKVRMTPRERQVFTTFANHVSAAVHNARLFDEMRSMALHDPLTQLPNRALLLDRLEQALARTHRSKRRVAVLFLDLDRFKVINDSLGHEVGDLLLVAAAERLTGALRPGDTATRFGGDEFVVLCEDVADEFQAVEIAERVAASLAAPFTLGSQEVFITVSVGVALANSPHDQPIALIRDADAAMYRAKDRGRARCELFDTEMRAVAVSRLEMENDLHRAIERGELEVHYQPFVRMADQRVLGAEALVRWHHPRRGFMNPAEFIPLAEETGVIVQMGSWILHESCRQLAAWRAEHGGNLPEDFYVSVNLAPRQLADASIVDDVATALRDSDLPPSALCLEITESALLDNVEGAADRLAALRAIGVRIALDDFGTGYSALSYLHQFPVDIMKIDRSFVNRLGPDPRDRAIVAGMIELAHALDLLVVAEGVETTNQLAELSRLGCDMAQGYYYGRPQPARDLTSQLVSSSSVPDRVV